MNKWISMGRLCADPEITSTQSGKTIAKFSLAVDRRFKQENGPEADFFPCVVFGKLAEFCERYLSKGTKVVVSGEPQNNNYTNKDGQKVYGWSFVLDEINFAESKNGDSAKESKAKDVTELNITEQLPFDLPFS